MLSYGVEVRFYKTASGAEPVREYLRGLPFEERKLVGAAIRAIQTFGLAAPGLITKHLGGKLWEIKPGDQRVFYRVATGPVAWLLHACRKTSQKTRMPDLELARLRMKEVLR